MSIKFNKTFAIFLKMVNQEKKKTISINNVLVLQFQYHHWVTIDHHIYPDHNVQLTNN